MNVSVRILALYKYLNLKVLAFQQRLCRLLNLGQRFSLLARQQNLYLKLLFLSDNVFVLPWLLNQMLFRGSLLLNLGLLNVFAARYHRFGDCFWRLFFRNISRLRRYSLWLWIGFIIGFALFLCSGSSIHSLNYVGNTLFLMSYRIFFLSSYLFNFSSSRFFFFSYSVSF